MNRFRALIGALATLAVAAPIQAQQDTIFVDPGSSRTIILQGAPLPSAGVDSIIITETVRITETVVLTVDPLQLGACTDYRFFGRSFALPDDADDACSPDEVPEYPQWLQDRIQAAMDGLMVPPDTFIVADTVVAEIPDPEPDPDEAPARVADLSFSDGELVWTAVDDGTGSPAFYDLRFGCPTVAWGSANPSSRVLTAPIGDEIRVDVRPQPGARCEYMLVSFRGELNVNAEFGPIVGPVLAQFEEGMATGEIFASASMRFVNPDSIAPDGSSHYLIEVGESINLIAAIELEDGQLVSPVLFPGGNRGWIESEWDGNVLEAPAGATVYFDPTATIYLSTEDPDIIEIDERELYRIPPGWSFGERLILRRDDDPDAGLEIVTIA